MRKLLLLLLLSALSWSCTTIGSPKGALDQYYPAVLVNPYVVEKVPLCAESLTAPQRDALAGAMDVVNAAFPLAALEQTGEKCTPMQPVVKIDRTFHRMGYTTPDLKRGFTITLKSTDPCVMVHELLHYVGLVKHSNPEYEPPGPMSDGPRGDCVPTEVDVGVLVRAYTGKPSF